MCIAKPQAWLVHLRGLFIPRFTRLALLSGVIFPQTALDSCVRVCLGVEVGNRRVGRQMDGHVFTDKMVSFGCVLVLEVDCGEKLSTHPLVGGSPSRHGMLGLVRGRLAAPTNPPEFPVLMSDSGLFTHPSTSNFHGQSVFVRPVLSASPTGLCICTVLGPSGRHFCVVSPDKCSMDVAGEQECQDAARCLLGWSLQAPGENG